MSYLVFARKYRPMSFDDVVAQEHVTRTLQNGIKNDRIGQGYLFCGPRGTGKTTTARILAKAVNCEKGPTPTPCGVCTACKEITNGSSLDVLEIDAASNTGVDDIRTLRENVRYMPTSGHKRIYVIDEVHRLSPSAFDALLKTLEEPPPHVMFIFATTEPLKVPETILSRTQRFDFKLVSIEDLAKHLKNIADQEKLDITESALRLVARKANGSVRDSLSLLDQIAAFGTGNINDEVVTEALGLVDKQLLFDFTEAIAAKDKIKALEIIKTIIEGGIDSKDFISELLEHFRVLLILATDKSASKLLNLSDDDLKDYNKQADFYSVGDIIRLMKIATDTNGDLKYSGLDERLLLELNAVKMAEIEATVKFEDVLAMIQQNPQAVGTMSSDLFTAEKKNDKPQKPKLTLVKPQTDKVQQPPVAQPLTSTFNLPILKSGWKQFLSRFHQKKPMLASQLGMVEIQEVKENKIVFAYPPSGENSKLIVEKKENFNIITEALKEHFNANISISFIIDITKKSKRLEDDLNDSKQNIDELLNKSPRLKSLIDKVDGKVIGIKKVEK
ncbi:MAG: DNA polymerase III subunit gamma/tau [Calditrichaeota bacterium]|nr:MAG: DNA polymerase III subunit gamma/tau [Calditrichota bacterium]